MQDATLDLLASLEIAVKQDIGNVACWRIIRDDARSWVALGSPNMEDVNYTTRSLLRAVKMAVEMDLNPMQAWRKIVYSSQIWRIDGCPQ
jgi:hypothetical protein